MFNKPKPSPLSNPSNSPGTEAITSELLQIFEPNVFEFDPHRLAGVKLHSHDAFGECQIGSVVGEVKNDVVVQVMLNAITFGNDDNIIPVI